VNINQALVNRALSAIGQDPLVFGDKQGQTLRYRVIKDRYLETFLEALSEVAWTGGRKRDRLMRTGIPHLKTGYRFAYDMPFDCARPIELQNNEYFVVEDRFICTDTDNAELLYVTNGKILRPVSVISAGRPGDLHETEYLSAGRARDLHDVTVYAGKAKDITDTLPEDPEPADDYPDYRPPEYEPKFYEYVEKTLAAALAVSLTGDPNLHARLLQEAMLVRQDAVTVSMGASAAKRKPQQWWKEELGL
jgi:hypothetical protein